MKRIFAALAAAALLLSLAACGSSPDTSGSSGSSGTGSSAGGSGSSSSQVPEDEDTAGDLIGRFVEETMAQYSGAKVTAAGPDGVETGVLEIAGAEFSSVETSEKTRQETVEAESLTEGGWAVSTVAYASEIAAVLTGMDSGDAETVVNAVLASIQRDRDVTPDEALLSGVTEHVKEFARSHSRTVFGDCRMDGHTLMECVDLEVKSGEDTAYSVTVYPDGEEPVYRIGDGEETQQGTAAVDLAVAVAGQLLSTMGPEAAAGTVLSAQVGIAFRNLVPGGNGVHLENYPDRYDFTFSLALA